MQCSNTFFIVELIVVYDRVVGPGCRTRQVSASPLPWLLVFLVPPILDFDWSVEKNGALLSKSLAIFNSRHPERSAKKRRGTQSAPPKYASRRER